MSDKSLVQFSGYWEIPDSIINSEISISSEFSRNIKEIRKYYKQYKEGCEFKTGQGSLQYVPSMVRFKKAADLINKETRFMFAKTPEVTVKSTKPNLTVGDETIKSEIVLLQTLINRVLNENAFGENILKAAKDCAIGERIAMVLNFNTTDGITLTFLPSTNFVFEVEPGRQNKLKKFVGFVVNSESSDIGEKRIFKKKMYLHEKTGKCVVEDSVYNGLGEIVEEPEEIITQFDELPVAIVRNDGLLGDIFGESEMEKLSDYESLLSKSMNAGIDAERMCMNPIRYAIDASEESTKELSVVPGSFWDIQSDQMSEGNKSAQVGILETSMAYASPLKESLERIRAAMYDTLDMPDISLPTMTGVITSGKALKSIYWGLIVRCEEKMKMWKPALRFICETIIEGARIFPDVAKMYIEQPVPLNNEYEVVVENQYPIQEDELEEKASDIVEVNAQLMSKKAYMMKWRCLTDEEAEEELAQIAKERQLLEDSFEMPAFVDTSTEEEKLKGAEQKVEDDIMIEEEEEVEE